MLHLKLVGGLLLLLVCAACGQVPSPESATQPTPTGVSLPTLLPSPIPAKNRTAPNGRIKALGPNLTALPQPADAEQMPSITNDLHTSEP